MGTKFIKVYRRIRKIYTSVLYQILNIITSILAGFAKRKERIQYKSNDRDLNVLLFGSIAQNDFNTLESLISTFSYSFDVSFCTLSDTEKITAVVIDNEDRKILKKDSSFVLDLGKNKIGIAFLIGFLYAISDEIHQMFSSGRSARVFDVCIDSCGVAFGIFLTFLVIVVYRKIKEKKLERSIS